MTDTEREALTRRIDELCAEVESWRMVATSRTKQCAEVNEANDALQTENVELRTLVADAHGCKVNEGCCEDCYADQGSCPIEVRMEQLGIEVD